MKKATKLFSIALSTTIYLTIFFIIALFLLSAFGRFDTNIVRYDVLAVLSGSMEPNIQTGSIIFIDKHVDGNDIGIGDIITYETQDNVVVTHRIIEANDNEYITKGDANDGADLQPVLPENIIGKYTNVTIPYVGYILGFISSVQGVLLFTIIPGILLLFNSFYCFWKVMKMLQTAK